MVLHERLHKKREQVVYGDLDFVHRVMKLVLEVGLRFFRHRGGAVRGWSELCGWGELARYDHLCIQVVSFEPPLRGNPFLGQRFLLDHLRLYLHIL